MSDRHSSRGNSSRGSHDPRNTPHSDQSHSPPHQYLTPEDLYRLEREGYRPHNRLSSEITSPRGSSMGSPGERSYASSYSTGNPQQYHSATPTYSYREASAIAASQGGTPSNQTREQSRHSPTNKSSRSQSGSPKDSPPGKGKEREKDRDESAKSRGSGDSRHSDIKRGNYRRGGGGGGGPGAASDKFISGVFIRY